MRPSPVRSTLTTGRCPIIPRPTWRWRWAATAPCSLRRGGWPAGESRWAPSISAAVSGYNFGGLGVRGECNMNILRRHATVVFGPQPPIHEHLILEVEVLDAQGGVLASEKAINDCVVTAGPPYRM